MSATDAHFAVAVALSGALVSGICTHPFNLPMPPVLSSAIFGKIPKCIRPHVSSDNINGQYPPVLSNRVKGSCIAT